MMESGPGGRTIHRFVLNRSVFRITWLVGTMEQPDAAWFNPDRFGWWYISVIWCGLKLDVRAMHPIRIKTINLTKNDFDIRMSRHRRNTPVTVQSRLIQKYSPSPA
jgi:hypothetical protein